MVNVAEALQSRFDAWLEQVSSRLDKPFDENKAFDLFWARLSPEDAVEVLQYPDEEG